GFESQRHEGCLSITRYAFDAYMLAVDFRLVGFKVIQCPGCSPCPRTQCAPVFGFPWLPMIAEPDDAPGQTGAVVSLYAVRVDQDISPSVGDQLLGGRRVTCRPGSSETGRSLRGYRVISGVFFKYFLELGMFLYE